MVILEKLKILAHAVPYEDNNLFKPYVLFQGNVAFRDKKIIEVTRENYHQIIDDYMKFYEDTSKEKKDPLFGMFLMMSGPYRIQFLDFIKDDISKKELSKLLSWIWTDTEFPNQYSQDMLVTLFNRAEKKILMEKKEYEAYEKLPEEITIYRGLQTVRAKERGLSWTLSKERANWFAHRWNKPGKILSAKIKKQDVFAYFSGRNEEEIVVNPRRLKNIKEE